MPIIRSCKVNYEPISCPTQRHSRELTLHPLMTHELSSVVSRIPDGSYWQTFYVVFYTKCTKLIHFSKNCNFKHNIIQYFFRRPIPWPRGLRFKAWVCGRSLVGIAGLNPAGSMAVCLVNAVCWQVEVSSSGWSPVQRSPTECGVSQCDREASIMRRRRPTKD